MQNILIKLTAILLIAMTHTSAAYAQEELGDVYGPSKFWTMLGVSRTWTPQDRDFPNGGFTLQSFGSIGAARTWWFGVAIKGVGVERRDVLAIQFGPGAYILGDGGAGVFTYLQTGIGLGSSQGLGGFDVFSDPTTTWGLATTGAVGGSLDVARWLRLHLAATLSWYTMEKGRTPYGLQFGVTFGGK